MKTQQRIAFVLMLGWFHATLIAKPLPPKLNRSIDQELIPAYLDGEKATILDVGTRLARRIPDIHLDALNEKLKQAGIPSLGKILLDARFELVTSNFRGQLPEPTQRELEMMLPAFKADIARVIQEVNASDFMKSSQNPPSDFDTYEDLLWKTHVAKNQIMFVEDMVQYGKKLARKTVKPKTNRRDKRDNDVAAIENEIAKHFDDLVGQVAVLRKTIDERAIELRIDRLELAANTFTGNASTKDKMKAAWVTDSDGVILKKFFGDLKNPSSLVRKRLRDPGLKKHVSSQIDSVTQLAGKELIEKSRLFYTGLHWWYRGRYGKGPAGGGFLKRETAYSNPAEMFGLYMPKETPKPTSPDNYTFQIPEIDRRHHHIWRFEYRRLYSGGFSRQWKNQATSSKPTSKTELSRFY